MPLIFLRSVWLMAGLLLPGAAQALAPDEVPAGVEKSDWEGIRAAYEAGRHEIRAAEGGHEARNPGLGWTTKWDGRGFLAQPASAGDGAWQWGLQLESYGFPGAEQAVSGTAPAHTEGQRLTYQWDGNVQEWYVNDQRGVEHGFAVAAKPLKSDGKDRRDSMVVKDAAASAALESLPSVESLLSFKLAVRGGLRPAISPDAQTVRFLDAAGAAVVTYGGLKVWDADGKVLPAIFLLACLGALLAIGIFKIPAISIGSGLPYAIITLCLGCITVSQGAVLNAHFGSAASVPVTAAGYTAAGHSVEFSVGFPPAPGTVLTVVNNTELAFISGKFSNLSQGQRVSISYGGRLYPFIANYYGGTGNDLVLQWEAGRLMAWGMNQGWLGTRLGVGHSRPVTLAAPVIMDGVLAGKTIVSVASWDLATIFLTADGALAASGSGYLGSLGNGINNTDFTTDVPVPVDQSGVLAGRRVVAIARGHSHTLALCEDGNIAAWGEGMVGDGSSDVRSTPVLVSLSGPLAVPGRKVVAIAAGRGFSLALCSDGVLASWGDNNRSGMLGNGTTDPSPVPVAVDMTGVLSGASRKVVAISAGAYHCLALCADGNIATWGENRWGQLGHGTLTNSLVPALVNRSGVLNAVPARDAVRLMPGSGVNGLVQCRDGALAAWGIGEYGSMGNGSTDTSGWPVLMDVSGVLAGRTVTRLCGGEMMACTDGTLVTWGSNQFGQLGLGTMSVESYSTVAVAVHTSSLASGEVFAPQLTWGGAFSNFAFAARAAVPPAVVTKTATSPTAHTATLNSKVYAGYSSTAMRFEYGVNPVGALTTVSPTTPATISGNDAGSASYTLADLTPGQTYRFRAIGQNGVGTTNGAWLTFTTAPAAPTLTTLAATSITSTSAVLNGTVRANGADANVYFRYFSPGVAGMDEIAAPALVTGTAATPVSASVTGLLPGTQYTFAVRASNRVGEGGWGNLTFTTLPDPAVGGLAEPLNVPVAGGGLYGSVIQPDGKTLIFGDFTSVHGTTQGRMARLLANGTLEGGLGFNPGANGPITCAALLADGKIMIGGDFTTLQPRGTGTVFARSRLARLLPDGTVDTTFANPGITAFVRCMAVQPDGAVLVGGAFHGSFMTATRNGIARITPAGTLDLAFNPNVDGLIYCLAVQGDGNVLIGGDFSQVSLQSRPLLARVNGASGQLDATYTPAPNSVVASISLQRDGRALVAGAFTQISGFSRNFLARLNPDGSVEPTFNPSPNSEVLAVALQANEKIVLGGAFTSIGGTPRSKVARVDTAGVLDGFNPNVTGGDVLSIALQADGKAQLAGTFTAINGGAAARSGYALLSNETAYQTLEKRSATELFWSRGGSAPEVLSVTFDQATFLGSTFTFVGNGTRIDPLAGDWRLSGIAPGLPLSGQIRVRARTASGYLSGSTGIMESKMSYIHSLPIVTTVSVSEITGTTALLTGTVDTSTLTAIPAFKFDTTTAYTQPLRIGTPASVTGTATFTYQVTGLTPGTAYVFRATAENAGGRVDGADISFTTLSNLQVSYKADGSDTAPSVSSYTATGRQVSFSLARPLVPGTTLMVVENTGSAPITGTFANLAQGQAVNLTHLGITYPYVAHYYGGTGNDLVLLWRNTRALSWGWNNLSQLGNGNSTNTGIPGDVAPFGLLMGKTIVSLSGGFQHSVALCVDGTIATWGDNLEGQLGNGDFFSRSSTVPTAVEQGFLPAGIHPVAVSAGGAHTLALFSDGRVYAWGDNQYGQVGSNDAPADHNGPVRAKGALNGKRVIGISAGEHHSLAVCDDGFVAAWGRGEFGQLGNGDTANQDEPEPVDLTDLPVGEKFVAVAAGRWHSMALTSGGKVFTWGRNTEGQLGDGTTDDSKYPVLVAGLTATAIYGGGTMHSLAMRNDGKLVAWGSNTYGQLGTGAFANSYMPAVVSETWLGGQSVTGAISGDEHILAVRTDGTLYAWGLGNEGRLGDDNTGIHTQPVQVPVVATALDPGDRWLSLASGAACQHSLGIVALSLQPAATTYFAEPLSATEAIIAGIVRAHGVPVDVTFDYGLTSAYGTTVIATPATMNGTTSAIASAELTGLLPGTTYHYQVKAVHAGISFAFGGDRTFTTFTRLQMWRYDHFGIIDNDAEAADGADPDGDGVNNLTEFAFGLHPLKPDANALPQHTSDGSLIFFEFAEPDTYMGITYGAEWSPDMSPGSWLPLSDNGSGANHSFKLSTVGRSRAFMRLKVTTAGP